jgi:hypothetical protein
MRCTLPSLFLYRLWRRLRHNGTLAVKNSHRPIELAVQLKLLGFGEGRLAIEQLSGFVADINHGFLSDFLNRNPCHNAYLLRRKAPKPGVSRGLSRHCRGVLARHKRGHSFVLSHGLSGHGGSLQSLRQIASKSVRLS